MKKKQKTSRPSNARRTAAKNGDGAFKTRPTTSKPNTERSQSVSQCVRASISGNSTRTAGPIGTGVAPFDATKRRNDDGACHGSIGGTWHMAHATA